MAAVTSLQSRSGAAGSIPGKLFVSGLPWRKINSRVGAAGSIPGKNKVTCYKFAIAKCFSNS
jgi:hypothetical protein